MPDYITGAEFGRWRTDFVAFRAELHTTLAEGFKQMNDRLIEINGRGRTNSEAISVLTSRMDKVDDDDAEIQATVKAIQTSGCAQLTNHGTIIRTLQNGGEVLDSAAWPRRKKVAIGGGLLAGGAGLWELVHALLDHFLTK